MKQFLVLSLFLSLGGGLWAEGKGTFEQGNNAYREGKFESARDIYEGLVAQGNGGLALSYNLGNVYFRLGQMGLARLWYERALEASPRNEDALYNRNLLCERVGETEPERFGLRGLAGTLWVVATGINVLFFTLLCIGLFRDGEWVWWGRWGTGILLVVAFAGAVAAQRQASVRYGVILSDRAEARTGPSGQEKVGFIAPEGHRVVLLGTINDWVQIGVPTKGLKGWVEKDAVEPVTRPNVLE
jgi:tetratricopeptide (TPR) repeat protein